MRSPIGRAVAYIVGSFVLVAALTLFGMWSMADHRAAATYTLTIAPGTADVVRSGGAPIAIPPSWELLDGDRLVFANADDEPHRIGEWQVLPGQSTSIVLRASGLGALSCTLHPSGQLALDVRPRGMPWSSAALPIVFGGLTLGGIVVVIDRVVRSLDFPEDLSRNRGPFLREMERSVN